MSAPNTIVVSHVHIDRYFRCHPACIFMDAHGRADGWLPDSSRPPASTWSKLAGPNQRDNEQAFRHVALQSIVQRLLAPTTIVQGRNKKLSDALHTQPGIVVDPQFPRVAIQSNAPREDERAAGTLCLLPPSARAELAPSASLLLRLDIVAEVYGDSVAARCTGIKQCEHPPYVPVLIVYRPLTLLADGITLARRGFALEHALNAACVAALGNALGAARPRATHQGT